MSFLKVKRIWSDRQFGLTKTLSAQDFIFPFYNHILGTFNKRHNAPTLFFDCTKSFDLIDHKLLLHKLDAYGVRGQALSWIISFLSGRKQRVRVRLDLFQIA